MLEELKNIKMGKKGLRQFGITLGIALALFGGLLFLRGKDFYPYLFAFSAVFLFLGTFTPTLLKPVQKVLMSITVIIGWLVTRLILIILFYLVVTPIGILARMFGKDFLNTKFNKDAETYWIAPEPVEDDQRHYENQF